jgi:hypothetical protein
MEYLQTYGDKQDQRYLKHGEPYQPSLSYDFAVYQFRVLSAKKLKASKNVLLITGNGLFPQGEKTSLSFQSTEDKKRVFQRSQWSKYIRDTQNWLEISLNVLTPIEIFGSSKDNLFLLHGCIADNSVPDRKATLNRYDACSAWLRTNLAEKHESDLQEIVFLGVSCCDRNGLALPAIIRNLLAAGRADLKIIIVDIKPKERQRNWVMTNCRAKNANIKLVEMDSLEYLKRLDTAPFQMSSSLYLPAVDSLNECFANRKEGGKWEAKQCPTSDSWTTNLWDRLVRDNGYISLAGTQQRLPRRKFKRKIMDL